ncbi:unnamed protein product [Rhodiola kirilowii]
MSEEAEKKFSSIMEKLIHSSKPKSASSSKSEAQSCRGKKRPYSMPHQELLPNKRAQPLYGFQNSSHPDIIPKCRPWDRTDLIKRLATFKAMTWFAKPKVVDAVNCARRGWINVDLDIIACESCGARLLFSTPSSWSQQQVEKAAQVFSLKLDSGHKSSCPWVDNACDEKLAQFPPMADQDLVYDYRQRTSALSNLLALPVISISAISHLKSPQFEHFLQNEPTLECVDRNGSELKTSYLGNETDTESAKKYYEAQKIISLCGWEPRSLPYVVDCEDQSASLPNADTQLHCSEFSGGHEICVYSNPQDTTETEDEFDASRGLQIDPNSVVLDCKLCGASVGLWAFSKIPRPLEFHRFVGYSEVDGTRDSENTVPPPPKDKTDKQIHATGSQNSAIVATNCGTMSKDKPTNLNLTIAGGPPPTKQSFRAVISLPAIGHNLRARLFADNGLGSPAPANSGNAQSDHGQDQAYNPFSVENQASITTNPPEVGVTVESHESSRGNGVENISIIPYTSAHESNIREKNLMNDSAPVHGIDKVGCDTAMVLKPSTHDKRIEFDPIRQHRHFCPWVTSTRNSSPGWKLVLSALHRQSGSPLSSSNGSPSSSKFIEVDDPISSIRKLFASPSPKRRKQMPRSG